MSESDLWKEWTLTLGKVSKPTDAMKLIALVLMEIAIDVKKMKNVAIK